MNDKNKVIRPTDDEARSLAKRLIRMARFGALATLEAESGHPLATRTALATDMDGTPIILISELSAHRQALMSDPRCSLMVGEPGRGDPLAHPRLTMMGKARRVDADDPAHPRLKRRYLARQPKAQLYVDFADFAFFRIEPERASLNGGFGKAFLLDRADFVLPADLVQELEPVEYGAVKHMNEDHREAIGLYATVLCKGKAPADEWWMASLDPEGADLVSGDLVERLVFPERLASPQDLQPMLVRLAKEARVRQPAA
ncbi:DUF2470 domain-containing protein [Afifella sp. H1R]|uniref:HugZ family pyridoxamine 5'-phosphate oxidase n=1 Tax=Afifella sp. H1R TaxID=2908841 RepID=UPI001F3AA999|nr:DUF2470 domain-containing protein [Afifella sp. H1R]MCF1503641.1 DUF2470 domain-containing protein [Afifella sp. H1R]